MSTASHNMTQDARPRPTTLCPLVVLPPGFQCYCRVEAVSSYRRVGLYRIFPCSTPYRLRSRTVVWQALQMSLGSFRRSCCPEAYRLSVRSRLMHHALLRNRLWDAASDLAVCSHCCVGICLKDADHCLVLFLEKPEYKNQRIHLLIIHSIFVIIS